MDNIRPICILLVGPPGSGKSTLATDICSVDTLVYVNQDTQGKQGHLDIFNSALTDGLSVIIDRMNFSKGQRTRYLLEAKKRGYITRIIVLHLPRQECLDRMKARKGHPTIQDEQSAHSALNTFFSKYERPTEDEADHIDFIYPNANEVKPKAIWCDLDGTLCDTSKRQHHVQKPEGVRKDWKSFFAGIPDDEVIQPVMDTVRKFADTHKIVYCSGRPDNYKKETLEWLSKHNAPVGELYMRPRNDSRRDDIVKEVILDFEIKCRYDITLCLDDRDQVVQKLRSRGLTVFQVASGSF